mmetsp:Transcript_14272/g.25061  ORF Transcript_14272/g.25061 Transcript_14272/m.25061 type:complete len:207 (+) Transcript_14272:179-799(+)|eukprot:CAMPEP_0197620134 /NCGR_PEP_ID=MMETSP1338-20131121/1004_1 /TAXON_ID=43686 ORGANISM="Pelagodinium beii, Strain RCC1491" /NCGR_SAMPLE_ID=MMETSP1338 /ASSEMBLY_ACC=CAM_ASM_000754 /LENGTH=206 /DNA_ID=CAMNT_0043189225 /DNA_START=176 /DNA_END=796 /DNA_ORIENTATION=-
MTTTAQSEVIQLVAAECDAFADRFFSVHRDRFLELPSGEASAVEQQPDWHAVYRTYVEEAELTMQNALMLWGVVRERTFEQDFVEAAQHSQALDGFLALTNYEPFMRRMYESVQLLREQDAKMAEDKPQAAKMGYSEMRPATPHQDGATQRRLAQLDGRLAELEKERNVLLLERRRLVGRIVEPTTTMTLKREIELQRYRDDVGLD